MVTYAISDRGRERANALARLLVDADVQAIITSQMIRTQQTADPIAKLKAIKPVVLPADKLDAVVERIRFNEERHRVGRASQQHGAGVG